MESGSATRALEEQTFDFLIYFLLPRSGRVRMISRSCSRGRGPLLQQFFFRRNAKLGRARSFVSLKLILLPRQERGKRRANVGVVLVRVLFNCSGRVEERG